MCVTCNNASSLYIIESVFNLLAALLYCPFTMLLLFIQQQNVKTEMYCVPADQVLIW